MLRYQHLSLFAANLLVPVGVVLFIVGFFRGRPPVSEPTAFHINEDAQVALGPAPFDKVIFMMVDALRSDFVYAEDTGFKYTQSLIRSGAAVPFTARAASPTLTLSRVKALTQGTSQSFLDVWLNVFESESARSLAGADTWLSRLKAERHPGKKMVFYGADLWLDLYSDIFDRFEGTDSWYLPEFTTVDTNVTRHLPHELDKDDWKALVLHYLGLDNVAHQGGPSGAHMVPKQTQMDDVVKLVYDAMEQKSHLRNTLFVMLGDHGMTEQGNHGGASPNEIAAAMVFISPKLRSIPSGLTSPVPATKNYEYYSVINQVDFVPTLAGLMGFTTPVKSLGIFAAEFLGLFEGIDDGLHVLFNNARQLKILLESEYDTTTTNATACSRQCGECLNDLEKVVCWLKKADDAKRGWESTDAASIDEVYQITRAFCDHAQKLLNAPPNNPSYPYLAVSTTTLCASMLLLWKAYLSSGGPSDNTVLIFGFTVVFHAPTMFIDDLVINEHHYWYWASIAWLAYLGYRRLGTGEHWLKGIAYPVTLQFISQSLDEATNPQYSVVDYVHSLLSDYQVLFWVPGLMIYVSALNSVSRYLGLGSIISLLASITLCIVAILSRLSSTYRLIPTSFDFTPLWLKELVSAVNRNQSLNIFWAGLGACLIAVVIQSRISGRISRKATVVGVVELANLYLRSLTRPEHLVLFPIFDLQLQWLLSSGISMTPSDIAVTTLLLGQSAFYASGHSNSFASFDLTNGFNGIETSRAVAVALQALLSNYFGPVWWSLSSLRMLLAWSESRMGTSATHNEEQVIRNKSTVSGIEEKNALELEGNRLSGMEAYSNGQFNGHANGKVDGIGATNGHANGMCNGHMNGYNTDPVSGHANGHAKDDRHVTPEQRTSNKLQDGNTTKRDSPATDRNAFAEHLTLQTFYTASTSLVVLLACIWKRNDPSIWTVLTPKCLNIILWAVFQHLMVNSVLCTAIWIFVVA